jgi:hypothetical protein
MWNLGLGFRLQPAPFRWNIFTIVSPFWMVERGGFAIFDGFRFVRFARSERPPVRLPFFATV